MMVLESPTGRQMLRNSIAEVLFRYFKVDHLCLYPSFLLSVIPTGLRTAVLVDVGRSETRAVAVFDSRVLLTTLTTAPIGWETLLKSESAQEENDDEQAERDEDSVLRTVEQ